MLKKLIRSFLVGVSISLFLPILAYADPINKDEGGFFEFFNIDEAQLISDEQLEEQDEIDKYEVSFFENSYVSLIEEIEEIGEQEEVLVEDEEESEVLPKGEDQALFIDQEDVLAKEQDGLSIGNQDHILVKDEEEGLEVFQDEMLADNEDVPDNTQFEMSKTIELIPKVEVTEIEDYNISTSEFVQLDDNKNTLFDDINDFEYLYLNKGFNKKVTPTFATTKFISGTGEIDTTVGIVIADRIVNGKFNITQESYQTIGASGIYSETFDLNIGKNFIIIAVKKDDAVIVRVYEINRKEEETKELLENITIDFINNDEEVDSYDNFVENITEQFKLDDLIDFTKLFE